MPLSALLLVACGGDTDDVPAASTTGAGGTTGGVSSSEGGSAGAPPSPAGAAGAPDTVGGSGGSGDSNTTTTGTAGTAGAAGDAGASDACVPVGEAPLAACEYPESLGGAGVPTQCGVTPGAWYPLGDSDFTTWPERAVWSSASGAGISGALGIANVPEMAFDAEGRLVIAWLNGNDIELRRWAGSDWQPLAAGAPTPPNTRDFQMVFDSVGSPVIVAFGDEMRVFRWDGAGWVVLDEWPVEHAQSAEIALDADDRPIVVTVNDEDPRLLVQRWQGSAFETLPGIGADGSLSDLVRRDKRPALAVRADGSIVVAWAAKPAQEGVSEPYAVYVRQFDGVSWKQLGNSASGAGLGSEIVDAGRANSPAIAVTETDEVLVGWEADWEASIRLWDGDSWLPAEPSQPEASRFEGLAFTESPQGSVYLSGLHYDVVARSLALWRWDAGEWTALDAPDTDSALSDTGTWPAPTSSRALAVGDDETLAYAWVDDRERSYEVYLMVNADNEWRELGEPTARGDGLDLEFGRLLSIAGEFYAQEWNCRIAHFDGQAWQDMDLSDWTDPEHCDSASLFESPAGEPLVALWIYDDPVLDDEFYLQARSLHLLAWTDAGWEELSEPYHAEFHENSDVALAFDDAGAPVVAWTDFIQESYHVSVVRWDGMAWELETTHAASYVPNDVQLLALPDDRMVLLWAGGAWSALYEAGSWTELPELALEANAYRSLDPWVKLARDGSGRAFVAQPAAEGLALFELMGSDWERVPADEAHLSTLPELVRLDTYADNGEIYVRRFEDCAWRGLSASDRGGGVSNSDASSEYPSLIVHDGATCVRWTELGEHEPAQLVRCHD